ncbi:hypothetical protein N9F73_00555 [bacterium]|nr:hypothetical protein [bacterium]
MPSSYTTNGGLERIATGEQSGTWGNTTNTNFDIVDRLTSGVGTIDLSSSGAAHTLTTVNGTLSDGMYKVLVLSGATEACTITVSPNDAEKLYFIDNNSGYACTFSQGSGANVTVSNGATAIVYCNGVGSASAVVDLITAPNLTGYLQASNNLSDLASAVTALTNLGLTATAAEINVLDGVTATTAELNILDGVTSTTAELNILDGVTSTAAELNYNDITTLGTSQASKVVTADANGDVLLSEELKAKSYNETYATGSSSSNVLTLNLETGNVFQTTLTENITTLTLSNPPASGTAYGFVLRIVQGASGFTVTWPSSIKWSGGFAPVVSTGSGDIDVYGFFTTDAGTTWYGFTAGQDMS